MLPSTVSDSSAPFRRSHARNEGFSETMVVDAHMRYLEPHEHAFYEGDAQTHIYRIKSGMMRLYRLLADGRRQVIAFRLPGHLIGLGEHDTQFCSAEALTEVVMQCVPLSIVYRRMQEEPRFGSWTSGRPGRAAAAGAVERTRTSTVLPTSTYRVYRGASPRLKSFG